MSGQGSTKSGSKARKPRRTPRRLFARPIGVLAGGKFEVVQATQLGEGGLGFIGEKAIYKADDTVLISMMVPGGGIIVTRGEIVEGRDAADAMEGVLAIVAKKYAGKRLYSVRFGWMPLQLRRKIRNYVTAKTEEESQMELRHQKPESA